MPDVRRLALVPLIATAGMLAAVLPSAAVANAHNAVGTQAVVAPVATTMLVKGQLALGADYSVIAVQGNGRAVRATADATGAFRLRLPTTSGVSFTIVKPNGNYYGPVLLATSTSRTLTYEFIKRGVPASGVLDLGTVVRKAGYAVTTFPATPAGTAAAKRLALIVNMAPAVSARAVAGKPVGAGVLGLVKVSTAQVRAAGDGAAIDSDRDGVINAFDIDDDGDLILDNVDSLDRRGSITLVGRVGLSIHALGVAPLTTSVAALRIASVYDSIDPELTDVINVNADSTPAFSFRKLDTSLVNKLNLAVPAVAGATRLYCAGQVYCGVGQSVAFADWTQGPTMQWPVGVTDPTLTRSEIAPGDVFLEKVNGYYYPGDLSMLFLTTPALASYQLIDDTGNFVGSPTPVNYTDQGASAGTASLPIQVPSGGKVKLSFNRPQRLAGPGEIGFGPSHRFIDIGRLTYNVGLPDAPVGMSGGVGGNCKASLLTTPSGDYLAEGVADSTTDSSNAGRTISFIIDLDQCAQNNGWVGSDWSQITFDISAQGPFGDASSQKVFFARI